MAHGLWTSQRLQYPLFEEYTLSYSRIPNNDFRNSPYLVKVGVSGIQQSPHLHGPAQGSPKPVWSCPDSEEENCDD